MAIDFESLKRDVIDKYGTRNGPNCSECMFSYAMRLMPDDIPPELIRIATPFGGGLARNEDTCGALIASLMVIGLKYGRSDFEDDKKRAYDIASDFYKWFKSEFGSTNCFELNHGDYTSKEHCERCGGKFVTESIRHLDKIFDKIDSGEE
ncbi:MAG: C-GCAxxG-C-C family protein [bacterium]